MKSHKVKYTLGTLSVLIMALLSLSATRDAHLYAAPDVPTYSYNISPRNATMSTARVTLRITNLLGQTPPSSTWYGPDGAQVSQACAGGQPTRDFIYSSGVLFEVRDYFYIGSCSRDVGRYTVFVGEDFAGSFTIRIYTRAYMPMVVTPPGPPTAFAKIQPADGATLQNPLSLTLEWEDSRGVESYAYCYDTTDDGSCANWVDTGLDSQVELSGLSDNTTYYWQVRASNSLGTAYADGAETAYSSFSTGEGFPGTWAQMTTAAEWSARQSHTSVVLSDGSIVLMGGYDGSTRMNDVWRSTDQGATWTQITAVAEWSARNAHTSVALSDDSIVLMGGFDGGTLLNDVWRSTDQGATWTQMSAAAEWSERSTAASVALSDDSIVLMNGSRTNDVWRSSDQGATWTQVSAAAEWSERFGATGEALSDDSIVIMGGFDGSNLNDVWRSTDQGATWTQMTAAAGWSTRQSHTSVALSDDSILVMSGRTDSSDVWRSSDQGANWMQVSVAAPWSGRRNPASVTLPDGSVVLMGGRASDGYLNDVWRFVPAD